MIKFENLSNESAYQLRFIIYYGIDKELDRALENDSTLILDIKILEEILTWYNQNILLSGKSLSEKLELLKAKNKKKRC